MTTNAPDGPNTSTEPEFEPAGARIERRRLGSPMRGALNLSVAASNPQTTAGDDFSIFVVIQNPFNVPVTIHAVETHIPVELMDMNRARIRAAKIALEGSPPVTRLQALRRALDGILHRSRTIEDVQTGIAIAVGTESSPEEIAGRLVESINIQTGSIATGGTVAALALQFPNNPTPDELDELFARLGEYSRGVVPIELQPGDSVVKQFVLRTRSWLLFTPLAHTLQIQVRYAIDDAMHLGTVAYQLSVRARLSAIALGSLIGAVLGALLRGLTSTVSPDAWAITQAILVSMLASVALVAAFARKSNIQPLVSVEDFWGGAVIGFSVGFFGFEQFFGVFRQ